MKISSETKIVIKLTEGEAAVLADFLTTALKEHSIDTTTEQDEAADQLRRMMRQQLKDMT